MGHVGFCGLAVGTRPGVVMTPRRASEHVVETALAVLGDRPAIVADVGTGSGAIAVALAAGAPQARVWATDTSRAAVALACENVRRHGLLHRVVVLEGDLLDPVPGARRPRRRQPPLPPGSASGPSTPDLAGEPADAVFAERDGLGPYRRLLDACQERLAPEGALVLQFRGRVLRASRDGLGALRARLEVEAMLARKAA